VDGLLDRRSVSLDVALALLAAVRGEASSRGLALAIAVVDDAGNVVASARMDGAALGAMPLAVGKAYTAVLWDTPTGALDNRHGARPQMFIESALTSNNRGLAPCLY
jgi:uncharacterized protein GlcG (DUF336 family)